MRRGHHSATVWDLGCCMTRVLRAATHDVGCGACCRTKRAPRNSLLVVQDRSDAWRPTLVACVRSCQCLKRTSGRLHACPSAAGSRAHRVRRIRRVCDSIRARGGNGVQIVCNAPRICYASVAIRGQLSCAIGWRGLDHGLQCVSCVLCAFRLTRNERLYVDIHDTGPCPRCSLWDLRAKQ